MEEDDLYTLNVFNMECIRPGDTILIFGDNDKLADKITKDICQVIAQKINFINVFAPSERYRKSYTSYIPNSCIYYDLNASTLLRLFKKQQENMKTCAMVIEQAERENSGGEAAAEHGGEAIKDHFNTLLILDRCSRHDSKWLKDGDINSYFEYSRDMHFTVIIRSIESGSAVPKAAGYKFDYCFVLNSSSANEHKNIFNTFAGMAPNLKEFRLLLKANIKDDQCLVVDKHPRHNSQRLMTSDTDVAGDMEYMAWTKNFCRYNATLSKDVAPLQRLGLPNLWEASQLISLHQRASSPITQQQQRQEQPDLGNILHNFAKGKKLRVQIVDEDENGVNDMAHISSVAQKPIDHVRQIDQWLNHL